MKTMKNGTAKRAKKSSRWKPLKTGKARLVPLAEAIPFGGVGVSSISSPSFTVKGSVVYFDIAGDTSDILYVLTGGVKWVAVDPRGRSFGMTIGHIINPLDFGCVGLIVNGCAFQMEKKPRRKAGAGALKKAVKKR